jgi:tol-pal system protein YbgF
MMSMWFSGHRRLPALALLAMALAFPAATQVIDIGKMDKRVTTLEGQMRAVQRKVFPGGDPKFFEPEITAQAPAPAADAPPASQPLDDLTARVDAMESQLRTLTGQMEALQFKQQQEAAAAARLRGDLEFRLAALEKAMAPPPEPAAAEPAPAAASPASAAASPAKPLLPVAKPAVPGAKPVPAAPAAASPAPAAAKPGATVPGPKPATAEAAYTAALAPVKLKDWPGTEAAMRQFVTDWPKSPRVPAAKYWQGRSLAERGQQAPAAKLFLDVYQNAPRSEKAPDALLGLAGAMNGLGKPQEACRVLDELASAYAEKLTPALQASTKALRTKAKCPA